MRNLDRPLSLAEINDCSERMFGPEKQRATVQRMIDTMRQLRFLPSEEEVLNWALTQHRHGMSAERFCRFVLHCWREVRRGAEAA